MIKIGAVIFLNCLNNAFTQNHVFHLLLIEPFMCGIHYHANFYNITSVLSVHVGRFLNINYPAVVSVGT